MVKDREAWRAVVQRATQRAGYKELDTTEQLNNNKITESSIKRLQLIKHLENKKCSLEEDSRLKEQNTKILSRRLPGMSEEEQGLCG